MRCAGALEVDLEWGRRAAAAALDARALSLAAGPRWFLAALAPRVPQPRRGLSLQARAARPDLPTQGYWGKPDLDHSTFEVM